MIRLMGLMPLVVKCTIVLLVAGWLAACSTARVGISVPIGRGAGVGVSVGSDGRIGVGVGVSVGAGSVSVGTSGQLPANPESASQEPQ